MSGAEVVLLIESIIFASGFSVYSQQPVTKQMTCLHGARIQTGLIEQACCPISGALDATVLQRYGPRRMGALVCEVASASL